MALTSVSGFVALLDDGRPDIKAFALKRLTELVDEFWAEISEYVSKIEILQEDSTFAYRKLAALLASKVYYNLGGYDEALNFALCAEELFDLDSRTEFVKTIITKCIDKYTAIRTADTLGTDQSSTDESTSIIRKRSSGHDEAYFQMENVVNRMFDRCIAHKQFKQALGIAIETRRVDIFEKSIILSEDQDEMMRYALRIVLTLVDNVKLRNRLLLILVDIYRTRSTPADCVSLCQCLVLMDDPEATASTLEGLLLRSEEAAVTAYQIGFDLYENATQQFLHRVADVLSASPRLGPLHTFPEDTPSLETETVATEPLETPVEEQLADEKTVSLPAPLSDADKVLQKRLQHLKSILGGDKVIELHLQFLIRDNKADLRLLERIKEEVRHSVTHNATVLANGIMHCGTTSDQFLRDHLSWLGKAVNWAKFTATATLGVIHRGHEKEALRLMSAYLPKDASGTSSSVYTEGGGLYALGLIHANHGGTMTEYLMNQCKEATAEPVKHGACLGLGLAAMGTGREDVYDQIKLSLYQDDAVTGEAAGLAMGLVMLGSGSASAVEDLLGYAKETSHEKIIRGIALGIALVMYARQEEADELISTLVKSTDTILRWCGMATIAMAYCGTGSNKAVQRLLHSAVSDNNDDVRRWALTAIGFIMFKEPERVPSLMSLLAESYHPHMRYGAAMAVGIACAGTANKDAISLLDTLLDGNVHFVRQSALLAQAMVMMQQNAVTCPKSVEFRERCLKMVSDRHEDLMAKFGAILAAGILDAGGCNMTISLQTRTGNTNMAAAVGLLVFQNFWFWFPFANFLSLALSPTALITLNKDLQMPQMTFRSNSRPSTFAYPPPLQIEKEKKKEKVATAVLSITAKHRKKEAEKRSHKLSLTSSQKMDTAEAPEKMEIDPGCTVIIEKAKISKEKEQPKEPLFCILTNPTRVMRAQQKMLVLPEDSRYYSIKPITQAGILLVQDRRPGDEEVLVEKVPAHGPMVSRLGQTSASLKASKDWTSVMPSSEAVSLTEASLLSRSGVHASSIGACLEDDEEVEASASEAEEEEEEEEEELDDAAGVEDDFEEGVDDLADDLAVSLGGSRIERATTSRKHASLGGSKSSSSKKSGGLSRAHEPVPPEPFLWDEDGVVVSTDTTTAAASATGTTTTTTTATASSSGQTATNTTESKVTEPKSKPEPMEVEEAVGVTEEREVGPTEPKEEEEADA